MDVTSWVVQLEYLRSMQKFKTKTGDHLLRVSKLMKIVGEVQRLLDLERVMVKAPRWHSFVVW